MRRSARPAHARSAHPDGAHRIGAHVHQARPAASAHVPSYWSKLADELRKLQRRDAGRSTGNRPARRSKRSSVNRSRSCFLISRRRPSRRRPSGRCIGRRCPADSGWWSRSQHAGIAQKIRKDMDVMGGLAELAERLPELAVYRPTATLAEFAAHAPSRTGFWTRGTQPAAVRHPFCRQPPCAYPATFSELCTPRVLTMEAVTASSCRMRYRRPTRLRSATIARHGAQTLPGDDLHRRLLSRRSASRQLRPPAGRRDWTARFWHGGPHRRKSSRGHRRDDVSPSCNATRFTWRRHLTRGQDASDLDQSAFRTDLADFVSHYGNQPLDNFELARR